MARICWPPGGNCCTRIFATVRYLVNSTTARFSAIISVSRCSRYPVEEIPSFQLPSLSPRVDETRHWPTTFRARFFLRELLASGDLQYRSFGRANRRVSHSFPLHSARSFFYFLPFALVDVTTASFGIPLLLLVLAASNS